SDEAIGPDGLGNALQPDLAPVGVDLPGAAAVKVCHADHVGEDDAGRLHRDHPAGRLVDDLVDAVVHLYHLPAVPQHLPVEVETPVAVVAVQRLLNLLGRFHPDPFARLQIELLHRALSRGPEQERIAVAAADPEPGRELEGEVLELVEGTDEDPQRYAPDRRVAVANVVNVLPGVVHRDDPADGPRKLCGLTGVERLAGLRVLGRGPTAAVGHLRQPLRRACGPRRGLWLRDRGDRQRPHARRTGAGAVAGRR